MSQKSSFPHPTDSVQYVLTSNNLLLRRSDDTSPVLALQSTVLLRSTDDGDCRSTSDHSLVFRHFLRSSLQSRAATVQSWKTQHAGSVLHCIGVRAPSRPKLIPGTFLSN